MKNTHLFIILWFTHLFCFSQQFTTLEHGFKKDSQYVYYYDQKKSYIDVNSFVVIDQFYAKDESRVYYGGDIIPKATPDDFTILANDYALSTKYAYMSGVIIEDADPNSFEFLEEWFARDKNHAYYLGAQILGTDGATFETLNGEYAKDKNSVFYIQTDTDIYLEQSNVIDGEIAADASSFRIEGYYGLDKTNVWYQGVVFPEADVKTFQGWGQWGKDDKHAFLRNQVIESGDNESFTSINIFFTKDNTNVYFCSSELKILETADPFSFHICMGSYYYAKDKYHVWYASRRIDSADVQTFTVLDKTISKDENHVFHWEEIINGADPATFELLNGGYAKDKNHVYFGQKIIQADPTSFKVVENGISFLGGKSYLGKDKDHTYEYGKIKIE
jgi:hypothetical protein